MKTDNRHRNIGSRHRAMSRYYMILYRIKHSNTSKNRCYKGVVFNLDKEEFIEWFMARDFKGCSVDRIRNEKGYTLDNLQLIPLEENIRKDRIKAYEGYCVCFICGQNKKLSDMVVDNRRHNKHGTYCKLCDNARRKRCKKEI